MRLQRLLLPLSLVTLAAGCASLPKRLEYTQRHSAAVGEELRYAVYAPRDLGPDERLPLVVFLHGGGDSADCFDQAGLGLRLDQALAVGRIPRVVVVVPDGELGFWENWRDGSHAYRDWALREVLPEVQQRYHTQACPAGCHVMGNSMGGYGALRFALLEPELFASVTAISAPIFDTDQMLEMADSFWWGLLVPFERIWGSAGRDEVARSDLFQRWKTQADLAGVRLLITWGDDDRGGIVATNEKFREHLRAHGIEHIAFAATTGCRGTPSSNWLCRDRSSRPAEPAPQGTSQR